MGVLKQFYNEISAEKISAKLQQFFSIANEVILDNETPIRMALTCMLAKGHLLIEDVPGVGKTTMAMLIAKSLGLKFGRIQFTNDLLPADILGNSIFNRETESFSFNQGPVFVQLLLADELNRATPKTQSALLEAMEESQVTIDGVTHLLPSPFYVIATQNPRQQVGTFPLPESELDRFLMRVRFGYPSREAEIKLLQGEDRKNLLESLNPILSTADILYMQEEVRKVHTAEPVLMYIQDILAKSRTGFLECQGLSPRAGLALVRASQAWAWLDQRDYILPEDVQSIAVNVIAHRLISPLAGVQQNSYETAKELLSTIPVP